MAKPRPRTRSTIARNLRALMAFHGLKQRAMEVKTGVSQRQIGNILNGSTSCSVETADALAQPFGLTGWQLMVHNLPPELIESPNLGRLVQAYLDANDEGRELLDKMAHREQNFGSRKK